MSPLSSVSRSVTRFAALALLALPAVASDDVLSHLLQSVELRYNGARTLQVLFTETYAGAGRGRQTEAGVLYLRKPGRMRWEYRTPAGKLFLSDGKQVYFFNPATNRAEKTKLHETEDMRAPLAFLLGKLDFSKDFSKFDLKNQGSDAVITAIPKSDKLPYNRVEFTVNPLNGYAIKRLVVNGQDGAVLTFDFANEVLNPNLSEKVFHFQLPPGAQWVDLTQGESAQ